MTTALAIQPRGLLRVEEAEQILAECKRVDEAREIRNQAVAISVYLRQHKAAKDAQADAWEIRYRAETRIGELLNPEHEKRGRKKSLPQDISRNQSSKWQQQARLAQNEPIRYARFVRAERERIIQGKTTRRGTEVTSHPDHDGDEWSTPIEIIEPVRRVLGEIDLDPASNAWAQKIIRAKGFYAKGEDGLSKTWRGRIFCNPPYSLITEFTNKLLSEWQARRITAAFFFVTSFYTNAVSFQRLLREASAACFMRRRVPFQLKGRIYTHHRQGHALFYFGNQVAGFRRVFDPLGAVVRPATRG